MKSCCCRISRVNPNVNVTQTVQNQPALFHIFGYNSNCRQMDSDLKWIDTFDAKNKWLASEMWSPVRSNLNMPELYAVKRLTMHIDVHIILDLHFARGKSLFQFRTKN